MSEVRQAPNGCPSQRRRYVKDFINRLERILMSGLLASSMGIALADHILLDEQQIRVASPANH